MRPWPNVTRDGGTVYIRGVADGIAHVLAGLETAGRRDPAREEARMAA